MQRELLRVIGDDRSFESFAGLALEIVDLIDADSTEPVPVRPGKKVAVDRSAGREHGLRSGAEAGIALIAQASLRETEELIELQLFIGEREQVLDLLAQLWRDVRHFQRGLQIAARLRIGAELIIQHAELVTRDAKLGILEAELLVGPDRRFNIALRGGRCCILNCVVEIAWTREHAGKQWIDVVEEIGATLGGNSSCKRNNKRRRAGGLGNQGQTCPLCAGCHLNVGPQPLPPRWTFPKVRDAVARSSAYTT